MRAFQTRRSGCSFIHELPTGAAETPFFERQRSCHRQASQSLIYRRFFSGAVSTYARMRSRVWALGTGGGAGDGY